MSRQLKNLVVVAVVAAAAADLAVVVVIIIHWRVYMCDWLILAG